MTALAPLRALHAPRLALCCLALVAFANCTALQLLRRIETPQVTLANVQSLGVRGFEARVRVDLRVANPNDFALELDGMRFDLDVNGRRFARGLVGEAVTLPRLGDALVSVEVTTNLVDALAQLARLGDGLRYQLDGDLFLTSPTTTVLGFRFASED